MCKHAILVVLLAFSSETLSAPAEVSPGRAAGGMAKEFKNHKLEPSTAPIPLPAKVLSGADVQLIKQAESIFDRNAALSIVMVDKGQIVFEKYKAPSGPHKPNFSWSMSKSLTAYTVGAMSCSGQIGNINRPAQTYSSDLKGTVYGEATVRELLMMSSGVKDAISSGNQLHKTNDCKQGYDCDGWQMQRSQLVTGVELIKLHPNRDTSWGRPVASGSRFSYNGNDTLGLSIVADQTGGFVKNFQQYIWDQAATESPGYWLLDKDNRAISQAGFSASSRDWARLAMLTIKQGKSDDCMGKFMQDATREHLPHRGESGKAFRGYGYQTWIGDMGPRKSYWWVGYGGQRVAVDPVAEIILVVTSYREDYMQEIYNLFAQWQRLY